MRMIRLYTVDISEVIGHVLFDFDKLVRGFPQDQVHVNMPILYVHSQWKRLTMPRQLDRFIDRRVRIFEENNFYIREPLGEPKTAPKKSPPRRR